MSSVREVLLGSEVLSHSDKIFLQFCSVLSCKAKRPLPKLQEPCETASCGEGEPEITISYL